jgi:hypothetical protein
MRIEALYRRPRTTRPEPGHKVDPYRLRGLTVEGPNQVWAMDITYIPMARGFVYLAVVRVDKWSLRRGHFEASGTTTARSMRPPCFDRALGRWARRKFKALQGRHRRSAEWLHCGPEHGQECELREVACRMGCQIVEICRDHGIGGAEGEAAGLRRHVQGSSPAVSLTW